MPKLARSPFADEVPNEGEAQLHESAIQTGHVGRTPFDSDPLPLSASVPQEAQLRRGRMARSPFVELDPDETFAEVEDIDEIRDGSAVVGYRKRGRKAKEIVVEEAEKDALDFDAFKQDLPEDA